MVLNKGIVGLVEYIKYNGVRVYPMTGRYMSELLSISWKQFGVIQWNGVTVILVLLLLEGRCQYWVYENLYNITL